MQQDLEVTDAKLLLLAVPNNFTQGFLQPALKLLRLK
jgi:hypothetical protein